MLPPLGPNHHHVDLAAAVRRAEDPLAPLEDRGLDGMPPNLDKDQLDLLPSARTQNDPLQRLIPMARSTWACFRISAYNRAYVRGRRRGANSANAAEFLAA